MKRKSHVSKTANPDRSGHENVMGKGNILHKLREYKKRIFDIIQIGNRSDTVSLFFDVLITVVIVLNISVCFLQTFDQAAPHTKIFNEIESVTVLIFVVEYALRLWTAEYLYPKSRKGVAVLKFAGSFYGVIDLLSFLPYFLPFFFPSGAVVFRMLRVVRILLRWISPRSIPMWENESGRLNFPRAYTRRCC